MLATLLFVAVLAEGGGEPAFMDDAFCSQLKTFTAAVADEPAPFDQLVDATNSWFGPRNATRPLRAFGPCSRYRFAEGWTITCHGRPGGPLEEAQPKLAARVGECLQLPAVAMPPAAFDLPVTEFRAESFTVEVGTRSCDRCRGMPELVLTIVAPKRP